MAAIIRVATPFNYYSCLLALAASIALFHGMRLRKVTGGQAPVVSFISLILDSLTFALIYNLCGERGINKMIEYIGIEKFIENMIEKY